MNKHRVVVSYNDNSSIKILTDFSDNSGEFPYIVPVDFNGNTFTDSSNVKLYYYTDILNSEEPVNIDVSDNFGTQSFSVSRYNISYREVSTLKDAGPVMFNTVRLQARIDNSSATLEAKELQVWVEGINIALTTNLNPTVNSSNYNTTYDASNVNDNSLNGVTPWFSSSGGNAYLEYVFSTPINSDKLDGIVWIWPGESNHDNYIIGQELILKNDNTLVASHSMIDFVQLRYTDGGQDMALFKGENYTNATLGTRSDILTNILSDSEPQVYIRTINFIQPDISSNFIEIDNALDNSATFTFYNDNSKNNQYILNPGTVYEFKVSSENDINNSPGTESDLIVAYTGIFTEEFTRNKINFTTNLLDNLIYPVDNTYYRLNDPTISINTNRINNDLSNALIKLSSVQGGGNNLIQIKDMIANFKPNFYNYSNFSYFEAKLSSSTINEDISGNIIKGGSPINSVGTNLEINSLNFGDDELPEGTKFGYFDNQDINVKLKGFNAGLEIYDLSFNNYLINSYENVVDLSGKTVKTIAKDPSSSILYGSNSLSIAVDDLSGNPSLSLINDTYLEGSSPIYYSGIPSMKVLRTNYGVNLQNIFSYWTKEILCSVSYNNSSTITNFTKDSTYYDYSDKVTVLNKDLLTNGNTNDIHVKTQNEDITLSSTVLYGTLTFNLTAFNVDSSQSLIHTKSYIHYDMSNESHPHILNNNISTYGERIFFNQHVDFYSSYPILSNISVLDNSSNFSIGNYQKECILFDGFYYGSNTPNIKKDWTTLITSFDNTSRYNYTSISNDRFVTFKFTKNLVSKELIINFIENSIDDKELYIKYKTSNRETVWFNGNIPFNGRSVYAGNRTNNDGIRYSIKTLNNFFVICPIGDNIQIYISVKIPNNNQDSKFKLLTITNTQV